MSQKDDTGVKTYTSGEELEANRIVKKSSGTVIYADSGDAGIGVTRNKVANGEPVAVELFSKQGTLKIEAAAAAAEGASAYIKNDGKVDDADAGSDVVCGVFLEAATAAGDIVEIMPALQL